LGPNDSASEKPRALKNLVRPLRGRTKAGDKG
jgi:hypothetical protein